MTTRRCHSCLDGEAQQHALLHVCCTRVAARALHTHCTHAGCTLDARCTHDARSHAAYTLHWYTLCLRCSALRSTRRDALLECALGEACWLGRPTCVARILDAGASASGVLKSWDASPLDVAWASWANGALIQAGC